MKCFYHDNPEAVAQCVHCGKGLCRECAERRTPCLCDDCYSFLNRKKMDEEQRQLEEEQAAAQEAYDEMKRAFFKRLAIGVAVMFFSFSLTLKGLPDSAAEQILLFVCCIWNIGTAFGWNALSSIRRQSDTLVFGTIVFWIIVYTLKAALSMMIGFPCFLFSVGKLMREKKNAERTSDDMLLP